MIQTQDASSLWLLYDSLNCLLRVLILRAARMIVAIKAGDGTEHGPRPASAKRGDGESEKPAGHSVTRTKSCQSKASASAQIDRQAHESARRTKSASIPPPSLTQQNVRILLIINISRKNAGNNATMCMIASELDSKSQKSTLYFQHEKLWINSETPTNGRRSHDVYERKGVNLKIQESFPLFSTGYGGENSENCTQVRPEATISMIAKTVGSKPRENGRNYVIEITPHSVLAPEKALGISHDLYDSKDSWLEIREGGRKLCY